MSQYTAVFASRREPNGVSATLTTMQSNYMKYAAIFCLLLIVLGVWFVGRDQPLVFVDGVVYTMDADNTLAQAALVQHGRIVATGSTREMLQQAPDHAQKIDLAGRALLPGFIDAHSHFPVGVINHLGVDISATSHNPVVNNDELLTRVGAAVDSTPSGQWVVGFNYDNTVFPSGQHPSLAELDLLSSEHPIYLRHISGHMGVANSLAMQALQIDHTDPARQAFVGIDPETGEPNGLLQEHAAPQLDRFIKTFSWRQLLNAYQKTEQDYLSAGMTTVQNGYANAQISKILRWAKRLQLVPFRLNIWMKADKTAASPSRGNHDIQRATVKLIVDGSPQGRTAFLTEPYYLQSDQLMGFRGTPLYTQNVLNSEVQRFHEAGYQLALHGNGDAAIDMIINAVKHAQTQHARPDARHILVHAQTVRDDQLQSLSALSMSPSFFNSHTYFWGDWHRTTTLGPARAQRISPLASADAIGLRYSLHSDAPVTPINPLLLVWSAVSRLDREGDVLGAEQRTNLMNALRAVTIDAAWQSHLEQDRGSIEAGKFADLVILSADPASVDDVRTLNVERSYIGGKLVFSDK